MRFRNIQSIFILGISYVEYGLFEAALNAYLKADKLKPNNEKITFNLGNLVSHKTNFSFPNFTIFNFIFHFKVLTHGQPTDG